MCFYGPTISVLYFSRYCNNCNILHIFHYNTSKMYITTALCLHPCQIIISHVCVLSLSLSMENYFFMFRLEFCDNYVLPLLPLLLALNTQLFFFFGPTLFSLRFPNFYNSFNILGIFQNFIRNSHETRSSLSLQTIWPSSMANYYFSRSCFSLNILGLFHPCYSFS